MTFATNLGYFLWGRHTGLFLYFPFALAALLLFLLDRGARRDRWGVLLGLVVVALFFLLFIPRNWQGGGGFVGNRYFVNAYPGFLFLVGAVRWRGLVPLTWGLSGLLLGPLLFSPFARGGPEPTLQSHVRNFPFPHFPLEHTLREIPGYYDTDVGGLRMKGRKDVFLPRGDSAWLRGASRTELWLRGPEPLVEPVFLVTSETPENRVELAVDGGDHQVLTFPGDSQGVGQRIILGLPGAHRAALPLPTGGDRSEWSYPRLAPTDATEPLRVLQRQPFVRRVLLRRCRVDLSRGASGSRGRPLGSRVGIGLWAAGGLGR